jgi:hypothetical protein
VVILLVAPLLAGCTGSDDPPEPLRLTLLVPDRSMEIGETFEVTLRLHGTPLTPSRVGLAHSDSSTSGIARDLLIESAFDEIHWHTNQQQIPFETTFTLEAPALPDGLWVRGVAQTSEGKTWSHEARIVLQPPTPPPVIEVRLHALPTQTYQYNIHNPHIAINGTELPVTQTGFVWSLTSSAHRDPATLQPSHFLGQRVLAGDHEIPMMVQAGEWEVPENQTLYLRAFALIDGSYNWSDEQRLTSSPPPLYDHNAAHPHHNITISASGLPLPHLDNFTPEEITIQRGQAIRWVNHGDAIHSASRDTNESRFHTGNLAAGATSEVFRFLVPGEYTYHCRLHPSTMQGTIIVTE